MKIKLNISAPELCAAINNLAASLSGTTRLDAPTIIDAPNIAPPASETTTPNPDPQPEGKRMTPAEKAKHAISAEIISLGGTPPDSGSVKKFQSCLDEIKFALDDKTVDALTPESQPDPETPTADPVVDSSIELPTNDDVRILASHMLKNAKDVPLAKSTLGAVLAKVGAESVTLATQQQLIDLVPLLEERAGVKLADAIAAV